jgi:UDP-N-acetylmuramoyl-tripeptide--D-alanyl-D-alanine ligase
LSVVTEGKHIVLTDVLSATGGTLVRAGADRFSGAVIDGRDVPRGALFFALKGPRFDGHDFVAQAAAAGADGAVVARGRGAGLAGIDATTIAVVEVDDPAAALTRLAVAHRQARPTLKVVAITGSNGKTTTKEMVAAILSAAFGEDAVLKTEGNLNNHLGVPLTLLRLHDRHRFAVIEMGMSALGEIAHLTKLAQPDVAAVVNVAGVHLETLGTIENVARAKGEIFGGLGANGRAVLPVDEPLLTPHVARVPTGQRVTFGPQGLEPAVGFDEAEVGPSGLSFRLYLRGMTSRGGVTAKVPLVGAHNARNATAAAAVATALEIGEGSILEGLAQVRSAKHRLQLVPVGDRTVLDDCYNASPLSTKAAIDALASIVPPGRQRIAVLGDMLELGTDSARLHEEVGTYAASRLDHLVTFGPQARHLADGARGLPDGRRLHTDDPKDAADHLLEISRPGDVILVKASRGLRLERVIDALRALLSRVER